MSIPVTFHHFGMAARDSVQALAYLNALGYSCTREIWDPLQGVHLHWCEAKGSPPVEIVTPPSNGDGPLASVLASQGTSFYHLCHEIHAPMSQVLDALAKEGRRVVMVREPLPSILFGGRAVSFHLVRGFGLVEFLHQPVDSMPGRGAGR